MSQPKVGDYLKLLDKFLFLQVVLSLKHFSWGNTTSMDELKSFLESIGIFDFEPVLNKTYERFDWHGTQTGWLWGFVNESPNYVYAKISDWKSKETHEFKSSNVTSFSEVEKENIKNQVKEAEKYAEQKQKEENLVAQRIAKEKWETSGTSPSPYLDKKGFKDVSLKSLGLRTAANNWDSFDLIVPIRDIKEELWSFQKITPDGTKRLHSGGRKKGLFHQLGTITPQTPKIYIAEGIATAISIYLATDLPTIFAVDAQNIVEVAKEFRKKYAYLPIIICGDDDRFTVIRGENINTGRIYANEASAACNGIAIFPVFKSLEGEPTDFNDLHVREGLQTVKNQILSAVTPNPKDAIKTQATGFHTIDAKGKFVPCYEDLVKFFKRKYDYKLLDSSQQCFIWNGKFYQECNDAFIECFAEEYFFPKPNNHIVSEFTKKVYRQSSCVRESKWFMESTETKLNFNNGVFDKESGTLEPHNSKYGFRYVLTYDYDPKATCPVFDSFSNGISKNEKDLQAVTFEYLGYCISNDECWLESALVLEGGGSNGKSTLAYVLKNLAGQDNFTTFSISDLDRLDNRYAMDGKLFNIAEETPRLALAETSLFKDLTSGGDIQARPLFKKSYKFHNKTKLIFACNELPRTKDTTYGLTRKLIIVPFRAIFSKKLGNMDVHIKPKLKAELPGIFNKVWKAYQECKKRGYLTESVEIEKAKGAYKELIDPLTAWWKETYEEYPLGNGKDETCISLKASFADYIQAMESQQEKSSLTWRQYLQKLARDISDFEARKKQKRTPSNNGQPELVLIAVAKKLPGEPSAF